MKIVLKSLISSVFKQQNRSACRNGAVSAVLSIFERCGAIAVVRIPHRLLLDQSIV